MPINPAVQKNPNQIICGSCRQTIQGVPRLVFTRKRGACSECVADAERELDEMRTIFEALLSAGVDRPKANRVMMAFQAV
jgi:succinate dehydrogenase/fumarate reductase-like Fe-S protein